MTQPFETVGDRVKRVPIWAWAVVLAGGILAFMWFRNRGKTSEGSDSTSSGEPLLYEGIPTDGLPPGAVGDFLDSNPTDPAYPVGLTPTGIPGPITNVQWSRLAFDFLVGQGNDPALVERALAKYIQGLSLTASEQAIVNLAQRAFGAPPEGLILLPPSPTPTVPNPPKNPGPLPPGTGSPRPTNRRYVIVARYKTPNPPWNSTLSGIATRYDRTVSQLVQWNKIKNPNVIYTGQKIWVDPP